MFDERQFVTRKQQQWHELNLILERVKLQGLRGMPPNDLARLGSLYRRTTSDLAFARTQRATQELTFYLNELVGQGHGILYQASDGLSPLKAIWLFFKSDLPRLLYKRLPFILVAILLTIVGGVLAYELVTKNPANQSLFIDPGMESSVEGWKSGFADHGTVSAGEGAIFSSFLMTHNLSVGILCFTTGITLLLPGYLLYQNGALMGALIAVVRPTGYLATMWAGILPHGVCELSAIFICGGAGMLLGWSFVNPGILSRKDALISNAKDAVNMVLGTIPLFIIAGILEGNVSHSWLPHWAKFSIAGIQFIALAYYIYTGSSQSKKSEVSSMTLMKSPIGASR